jgi:hypothetical protein
MVSARVPARVETRAIDNMKIIEDKIIDTVWSLPKLLYCTISMTLTVR